MRLHANMAILGVLVASCGQPPAYVLKDFDNQPVVSNPGVGNDGDATKPGSGGGDNGDPTGNGSVIDIGGAKPTGKPQTPKTPVECHLAKKLMYAPTIVFLVDNSGSNSGNATTPGSDCPDRSGSTCTGEPVRKLSILQVMDDLQKIDVDSPEALASTRYSVVAFSSNSTIHSNSEMTGDHHDREQLANVLNFTKNPSGSTSYLAAFAKAKEILDATPNDRAKMIVNISDGFPTNAPQDVFNAAKSLRDTGAKMLTVIYTKNEDFASIAAQWESQQNRFTQAEKDWVIGRNRPSLISDISDHAYLVKDTQILPNVVSDLVRKIGVSCR